MHVLELLNLHSYLSLPVHFADRLPICTLQREGSCIYLTSTGESLNQKQHRTLDSAAIFAVTFDGFSFLFFSSFVFSYPKLSVWPTCVFWRSFTACNNLIHDVDVGRPSVSRFLSCFFFLPMLLLRFLFLLRRRNNGFRSRWRLVGSGWLGNILKEKSNQMNE